MQISLNRTLLRMCPSWRSPFMNEKVHVPNASVYLAPSFG